MNDPLDRLFSSRVSGARAQKKHTLDQRANESLTFSSRSRGTCCAVILERLAETVEVAPQQLFALAQMLPNIFWSRTDYISEHMQPNGRNFEP